ncbi:unnamed protein product [Polarella glacialis]|uniref:Uncharacterized protein n=1 Tax=Polarella glacialis TaxID=89957 RepID=A0A813LGX4_POLGL|nr:unnamed protein product [Polarella glacialis]
MDGGKDIQRLSSGPLPSFPFLAVSRASSSECLVLEPESDHGCSSSMGESSPALSPAFPEKLPRLLELSKTESSEGDLQDCDQVDVECLGWTLEESAPTCHLPEHQSQAPKLWRAPWRKRVLRTLGLERWWTSSSDASQPRSRPASEQTFEAALGKEETEEDEEDRILSSQLVAAVRNAEFHAASSCCSSTALFGAVDFEDAFEAQSTSPWKSSSSVGPRSPEPRQPKSRRQRSRVVQFHEDSQACFFGTEGDDAPEEGYKRLLQTKVFDGPSGHKARRTGSVSEESDVDASDEEEEEDEEEEFEDRCDEIAELMSRQRTMLLWSESW